MTPLFAFINNFGPQEILLLIIVGVILFGRRLPEIGRSLVKTVVELKKGVKGLEDEVSTDSPSTRASIDPEPIKAPQRITNTTAPRFDDAPANNLPPKI